VNSLQSNKFRQGPREGVGEHVVVEEQLFQRSKKANASTQPSSQAIVGQVQDLVINVTSRATIASEGVEHQTSRLERLNQRAGTSPVNEFSEKSKKVRLWSSPMDSGRAPDKSLEARLTSRSCARRPSSVGMTPC
jgi:hypothetical protein